MRGWPQLAAGSPPSEKTMRTSGKTPVLSTVWRVGERSDSSLLQGAGRSKTLRSSTSGYDLNEDTRS
jgi:hypothetical protein